MLDAKEYLHLAINASNNGDHHASLNYLKEALNIEPENASAMYLLAAEHAELGLYDRAIDGMEKCLQLDPNIEMARFQLGLLYAQAQQTDQAKAQWGYLHDSQDESLKIFASALVSLMDEKPESAQEQLIYGLSKPNNNPALKRDMEQLLERVSGQSISSNADVSSTLEKPRTTELPVYLGAYQSNADNDDQ